MITAPTPEEVHALAARLGHCVVKWGKQNALSLEAYSAVKMMRRLQADNERLRGDYALRGAQIQRMAALIDELEGKIGRFQGVPLPLIEAINAATGSNDWQGDKSPAELLEPACRAIEALRAERPMPTVEDASQEWGKVDPITAWHLIERHADNWADIGKMMTEYVQAQIARAELEARKPLPLSDEQIDAIADGMPGGLGGFMKTWGWRQFARKILDLRAPPTWEPQFDCMAPGQEELAVQFCAEIAGPRGQPGRNPDPVRLLEMAEALYKAEADARPKET